MREDRMRAADLALRFDKLDAGATKAGDLAFYGGSGGVSHVVMLMSRGGRASIGANGGSASEMRSKNEPDAAYAARHAAYVKAMADKQASVRIVDHRHGGALYRKDLLGYGRLPWELSTLA